MKLLMLAAALTLMSAGAVRADVVNADEAMMTGSTVSSDEDQAAQGESSDLSAPFDMFAFPPGGPGHGGPGHGPGGPGPGPGGPGHGGPGGPGHGGPGHGPGPGWPGHGGPGHGGPGHYPPPQRQLVCYARSWQGQSFRAFGYDANRTQWEAQNECERWSRRRCEPMGCNWD